MKKLLLFFTALLSSGAIFAQTDCSDIFISEYVEGWYNNKALELYNPTNAAITLDNTYRLIRWSNGSTTSNQDPLYVLPLTGKIDPYKVMVIIQDTAKPGQDTMVWLELRKKGTWLAPYDYGGTTPGGNVVFWNGDDAISLQKLLGSTWKDIDIFGEIGVRPLDWQGGTTGAWTDTKPYWKGAGAYLTKDQTLVRKNSVKFGIDRIAMGHYGDTQTGGFPDSFYALAQYDSFPSNFFEELGQHWCDCNINYPVAEFLSDSTIIKVGGQVLFSDESKGTPASYLWTFWGGNPASSTLKTPPPIVYNSVGNFEVSLMVSNEYGKNTKKRTDYIVVGALGVTEIQTAKSVVILPNPVTNNQFTVNASFAISSVQVVSVVGQTVYSMDFATRSREIKVQLNDMPQGIYLVKIRSAENQSVVKKIILQ
jgi:PKD repeat protein